MYKYIFLIAVGLSTFISCEKKNSKIVSIEDPELYDDSIVNSIQEYNNGVEKILERSGGEKVREGNYCFLIVKNKDSILVKLRILSKDDIRGEMTWRPWQRKGVVGRLSGKLNSNQEMELLYDYIVEGNRQTETKIMKIEKGKLLIKIGALEDPKNDGNFSYKDVSKAVYKEILNPVDCFND